LKLENVLFVQSKKFEVKLIDFGFSEKINPNKLLSKAGTPGFLPPELFSYRPFTGKGDIFSAGIILYCLIGGRLPF
jgi:serine/threonine protein kinase